MSDAGCTILVEGEGLKLLEGFPSVHCSGCYETRIIHDFRYFDCKFNYD